MKYLLSILPVIALSSCLLASEEGFEAPAYVAGQILGEEGGWQVSEKGEASISAEESALGAQSLFLSEGTMASKALSLTQGVRYLDLCILPKFGEEASTLKLGGATITFAKLDGLGRVMATGQDGVQTVLGSYPLTQPDELSETWIRITARQDLTEKKWDLYLDGKPVRADLALVLGQDAFEISLGQEAEAYLDAYHESASSILFPDADNDGMPDAEEIANGLNPYGNDRDGDIDGDGISNVDEFAAGSSPSQTGSGQNAVLYVDNLAGNDGNDGKTSYARMGSGPKSSIKGAMAAAPSVATIVILPGKGVYVEGSRNSQGKKLTIRTVSTITIK